MASELQDRIATRQSELWKESRDLKTGSVAYLALVSSGAIVVSVNALVPIIQLHGNPTCLWFLIGAWGLLLSATISTVPYRLAMAGYLNALARHHDYLSGMPDVDGTGKKSVQDEMQRQVGRQTWWARATWTSFLAGVVLLLVFVAVNVR